MVYFDGSGIFSDFAETMGSSVPVVIVAFGADLKKSVFLLVHSIAHPRTLKFNAVNSVPLSSSISALGFV